MSKFEAMVFGKNHRDSVIGGALSGTLQDSGTHHLKRKAGLRDPGRKENAFNTGEFAEKVMDNVTVFW